MLNASYSSGENNRVSWPAASGVPFPRQGVSKYQAQGADFSAGVLSAPFPPLLPNFRQDSFFAVNPAQSGWAWPQEASPLSLKPDKFCPSKVTEPFRPLAQPLNHKNAPLQLPKALPGDAKANSPKVESKTQSGKFSKEKTQPPDGRKVKTDPHSALAHGKSGHGKESGKASWLNASTFIGAFKVTSALIVTGGINAFFFGVPLYIASGLSALVAGSQSLAALKIHKEDNEFTRKIVAFSRKVMGRQDDLTPGGKEWSMVPVWATICGFFGLSEAMGNHIYKQVTGYQEKSFRDREEELTKVLHKDNGWLNVLKPMQDMQLSGMKFVKASKECVEELFKNWAAKGGVLKIPHIALQQLLASSGGRNMPLAYLWSFGIASFGGAFQTALAALIQQKVDKANGIHK
jgi:hypothetical protein